MSEETIKRIGDELIRLCDGVERHGLVDYQYGVWEEQIESSRCPPRMPMGRSEQELTTEPSSRRVPGPLRRPQGV